MEEQERPSKRPRLEDGGDAQILKEARCGIRSFVQPRAPRFHGTLKQRYGIMPDVCTSLIHLPVTLTLSSRYTDFIVNELLPDGAVVRIQDLSVPKKHAHEHEHEHEELRGENRNEDEAERGSVDHADEYPSQTHASSTLHDRATTEQNTRPKEADLVSEEDTAALTALIGAETTSQVINLYRSLLAEPNRKSSTFPTNYTDPITSRADRTNLHQLVRRVFSSRLETLTRDDGTIAINAVPKRTSYMTPGRGASSSSAAPGGLRGPNLLGWQAQGGEYLHFTLHKENRDTMEVLNFIAGITHIRSKRFAFAGTKDRRAVTTQRCCVYRMAAGQLHGVCKRLKGSAIGNYEYKSYALTLGDLGGNAFVITLRNAGTEGDASLTVLERQKCLESTLSTSVSALKKYGFLNYYGLQRFGTLSVPTHIVGMRMLQGDLKSAVDAILSHSQSTLTQSTNKTSTDDYARAAAIQTFNTSINADLPDYSAASDAAKSIPRKFSAESQVMKWLSTKNGSKRHDYQGALMTLPRNLRLMYVHAYQSFVWNAMVSHRWEVYGNEVVAGDLVLVSETSSTRAEHGESVDQDGEEIVHPSADDSAGNCWTEIQRARPLSAEEAASGAYTIADIVLPLPGYDIIYPPNSLGEAYRTFMGSSEGGALDPHAMRRGWKDVSLTGGYRRILGKCLEDVKWEVKRYMGADEQLVQTDLELLKEKDMEERVVVGPELGENSEVEGAEAMDDDNDDVVAEERVEKEREDERLAVILRLSLGPSTYATMALRELMRGGCREFRPEFGAGLR